MSIVNLIIFLVIMAFALLTSNYLVGLAFIFVLMVLEIVEHGMAHSMFLAMCELAFVLFVIEETKRRKGDSPLLKYNPLYKNNVLPKKLQIIICTIFLLALLVRIIAFFYPVMDQNHGSADDEYRRETYVFINKLVIAHKRGEDYHSVAKSNPFTNDVFVCKVVALLESEYGRVDYMNRSVSVALQSNTVERAKSLQRLSDECVKESSNVVQRIITAGIGDVNAKKMAIDFSTQYKKLHQRCCKAVEKGYNDY